MSIICWSLIQNNHRIVVTPILISDNAGTTQPHDTDREQRQGAAQRVGSCARDDPRPPRNSRRSPVQDLSEALGLVERAMSGVKSLKIGR